MMKIALALIMVIVANVAMAATVANQLSAVDPLIGTGQTVDGVASCEKGATMPYVGVPFGSVMWVPMTRESQFGTLAFNQQDAKLLGFAASRQMAVAMGEWGEFSFLPTMGTGTPSTVFAKRGQTISAKSFTPYSGSVSAGGVKTDYTATAHAAIYKITFPGNATRQPQIVFDASRDDMFRRFPNTATVQPGGLTISDGGQTVVAWNTDNTDWYRSKPMPGYRARFRMEFSEKPVGFATYRHAITKDGTNTVTEAGATSVEADACGATFTFAQSPQVRTIFVKCSVSLVSNENLKSLMDEEIVAWDFDGTLNETQAAWNEKFSLLKFSSGDSDVTKTLATAIYHALQWPRDVTEFGRHYSPATDEVRDGVMYTGQSMWDTYRAENALLGFLAPDRIGGMMKSLVNIADESGYLPLYPNPGETSCMVGAPGEVQLAEAVQKGWLTGADAEAAYAAAKRNATVPSANDAEVKWRDQEWWTGSVEGRGGLTTYQSLGYVACDRTCQSVSRTQDFSHADDAMARFAAFLGKDADAAFFAARSHSWTNLWKRDERNVAPRNAAGAWVRPEDCILDGNPYDGAYSESGAAQARWAVPHDVPTLVRLLGGTDAAVRELDGYEASVTRAKDGLVLHDDHGNEPAHHIPYLYNLLGSHDACAKTVREIMADYYPSSRQWRRGHDDCGQMSAWYVLSALGFYPVNPADLTYRIGSPLVDAATLDVGGGKTLRITVNNQAKANVYVKSVKLNGVELADRTITHVQVMAGGDLVFEMSDAPEIQKKPISYIDADGVMQTKFGGEYDVVTAETAVFGDGWHVVTGEVLRAGIDVAAGCTANLVLCDGASLTVTGDTSCAGIDVRPGETLNIYGQANGTGRLAATGGSGNDYVGGAGIGGGYQQDGGTVTINGGTVTAYGMWGAGIGGGFMGEGDTVTINGGTVTASSDWGSGMGGGVNSDGEQVRPVGTINLGERVEIVEGSIELGSHYVKIAEKKPREMDPIGVCSWSWHEPMTNIIRRMEANGFKGIQLALSPWVWEGEGSAAQKETFGDQEGEEVFNLISNKFAKGELDIHATMICFSNEDYTTEHTISNTCGFYYGLAPSATEEQKELADLTWEIRSNQFAKAVERTRALGVRNITAHIGLSEYDDANMSRLYWACKTCRENGCKLLVETGMYSAERTVAALKRFTELHPDAEIGLNFDTANQVLYGADNPTNAYAVMKGWIEQVHIKDCVETYSARGSWATDVEWGRGDVSRTYDMISVLKADGFTGPMLVEHESGSSDPDVREREILTAVKAIRGESAPVSAGLGEVLGPYLTAEAAAKAVQDTAFMPNAEVAAVFGADAEAKAAYCAKFGFDVVPTSGGQWAVVAGLKPEAWSNLVESAQAATRQIPVADIAALELGVPTNVTVEGCVPGFYYTIYGGSTATNLKAFVSEKSRNVLCEPGKPVKFSEVVKPSDAAGFFSIGVKETGDVSALAYTQDLALALGLVLADTTNPICKLTEFNVTGNRVSGRIATICDDEESQPGDLAKVVLWGTKELGKPFVRICEVHVEEDGAFSQQVDGQYRFFKVSIEPRTGELLR